MYLGIYTYILSNFVFFGAIPNQFEILFLISWENNRDCHITMPLPLKTIEVQIKGDQWNIDQGKENLVRLGEELELSSGARVNLVKMTEKLMGKIQEKLDLVWVSGEFVLSECELSGFYCKGLCSNYQDGGRWKTRVI